MNPTLWGVTGPGFLNQVPTICWKEFMLYYAMLYCTVLHYTVLCYTRLYTRVEYYTYTRHFFTRPNLTILYYTLPYYYTIAGCVGFKVAKLTQ